MYQIGIVLGSRTQDIFLRNALRFIGTVEIQRISHKVKCHFID